MKPLQGIRIADFTIHAAGPFCTHMLSQFGAECIKIESALRPDAFRKPHAVYGRLGPATFDQVSANKLSVRINLKHSEGAALAKRIVGISDLAAESFRPGVMKRLGLDYDALRAVKPDIVLLSLSSSGQTGPDSHFAGYAPLFGAWGGLGYMSGYPDGPPMEMRHVMDHSVGFHAATGAMAALHRKRMTGKGEHVDIAARDVAAALIGDALLQASAGMTVDRLGNSHMRMTPHGVYLTRDADRWVSISVGSDKEWREFLRVIGKSEVAEDARFTTEETRLKHRLVLDELMSEWLSAFNAEQLVESLQKADVAAHVCWNSRDLVEDSHMRERGAIVNVQEPDGKIRFAVGAPARFSKTEPAGIARGTPDLGQDEDYVYGELLGISAATRRELEDRQVIF